jgi:hypothetical protein
LVTPLINIGTGLTTSGGNLILANPSACHENAYNYVKVNPGASVCPGWLILGDEENGYTACAHAVVGLQNGDLINITPFPDLSEAEQRALRFVHHSGNENFGFLQEWHSQYRY